MTDLVEWLRAQLDEDERLARLAIGEIQDSTGVWTWTYVVTPGGDYKVVDQLGYSVLGHYDVCSNVWDVGPHVAEHDPARVLREVAAKRWILAQHPHVRFARLMAGWNDADVQECPQAFPGSDRPWVGCKICDYDPHYEQVDPHTWCDHVRVMAAVYSHRPGYREEWRP